MQTRIAYVLRDIFRKGIAGTINKIPSPVTAYQQSRVPHEIGHIILSRNEFRLDGRF
jgi:hypothetical protein